MGKKIIYSGFLDKREFIIDYLHDKHGWTPVFIIGFDKDKKRAKEKFGHVVMQDYMQLRKSRFDYSEIGAGVPIDKKILDALSKYEVQIFKLMEDTTGWNFSFDERRRFYYELIKFWNTVIHNLKPELFVCWTWPHVATDYTLYRLCEYHKIPYVSIYPVPLFDNLSHYFITSLEDFSVSFRDAYNSGQVPELQPEIKEFLNRVRSREGDTANFIKTLQKRGKKNQGFQFKALFGLLKSFLAGRAFQEVEFAFKHSKHPIYSSKAQMNRIDYFLFFAHIRRTNKKLLKTYKTFTRSPDFYQKYICFAPSRQPEAFNFHSGVYEDNFLILDILSASIPDDWVIYYKEHPGTFLWETKGCLRRSYDFYQRVASYKNVYLVPCETDIFKLIDNSQAVATPVGTTSWEAALRGKPALFFGSVWYQACKSLFKIESYQDCRDAIEKIKGGFLPDQQDIENYAAAIQQVMEKELYFFDYHSRIKTCPNPKYEMERIAKALYKAHKNDCGGS